MKLNGLKIIIIETRIKCERERERPTVEQKMNVKNSKSQHKNEFNGSLFK